MWQKNPGSELRRRESGSTWRKPCWPRRRRRRQRRLETAVSHPQKQNRTSEVQLGGKRESLASADLPWESKWERERGGGRRGQANTHCFFSRHTKNCQASASPFAAEWQSIVQRQSLIGRRRRRQFLTLRQIEKCDAERRSAWKRRDVVMLSRHDDVLFTLIIMCSKLDNWKSWFGIKYAKVIS